MKIALYLGSFNPFHNGHLQAIKTALNDFKMDRVIIVPTMRNPWKKEEEIINFNNRISIIRVQLQEEFFPKLWLKIGIDNIERFLIPPYYSYATLHALKNKYCNDEIFVLCGEDTMKEIPNWMNGEQIIKDYDFLVVDRPTNSISSSLIREIVRTRNKMDAYYSDEKLVKLVSPSVINLIKNYYGNFIENDLK